MWARGVGLRVFGEEMAAEPVPVRRPGVLVIGSEEVDDFIDRSTGEETGSTNIGLKLTSIVSGELYGVRWGMSKWTNRNASQRSSIHEAQFDTITSPALGLQEPGVLAPRLYIVSLSVIAILHLAECSPPFTGNLLYWYPPQSN